jgi:type III restriction enzyme
VGDVTRGCREFQLNLSAVRLQPADNEILIQELHRREQFKLMSEDGIVQEDKLENYLVRGLIDFNDIYYDDHAALLYQLARQVVEHLRSYLKSDDEVVNVLQYHQQVLVNLIHVQVQGHYKENATAYKAHVSKGFTTLHSNNYSAPAGETERDFCIPVIEKQDIFPPEPHFFFLNCGALIFTIFWSFPQALFSVSFVERPCLDRDI